MNPGAAEEIGKTAQSTIDALKSTPMILGVLLFNLAFIVFIGYFEYTNGERWERTVERTIRYCSPASNT